MGINQTIGPVGTVQAGLHRGDAFQNRCGGRFGNFVTFFRKFIGAAHISRHRAGLFYCNSFSVQGKGQLHRLFVHFKFRFGCTVIFYIENTRRAEIVGTVFFFAAPHDVKLKQEEIFFHGFDNEAAVIVLGAFFPRVTAFRFFPFFTALGHGCRGNGQHYNQRQHKNHKLIHLTIPFHVFTPPYSASLNFAVLGDLPSTQYFTVYTPRGERLAAFFPAQPFQSKLNHWLEFPDLKL